MSAERQRQRRVLLALLRVITDVLDLFTPDAYTWSLDLSRAYKRRRYMVSYRYIVGGECVRSGFVILFDATAGELYARPARRLDSDPPLDVVAAAYRWLALSGQLDGLLQLAQWFGVELQRYSETPHDLAAWIESHRAAYAPPADEAEEAIRRDAAGLAPRDSFSYGR